MSLRQTRTGRTYLHVWRGGRAYERDKGSIYRSEWNNLRFTLQHKPVDETDILHADVRHPLPYPDESFDAIDLFHIVEHLTPEEARRFLAEIRRILRPGGIVRLSTPDLEGNCRAYLARLEDLDGDDSEGERFRYEWAMLELFDQMVRTRPGGRMTELKAAGRFDPEYARERFGDVFDEFHAADGRKGREGRQGRGERGAAAGSVTVRTFLGRVVGSVRGALNRMVRGNPHPLEEEQRLAERMRASGELNLWLYDHLSLRMLLEECGFADIERATYRTSRIPEWERFDLDRSSHGEYPFEPSLYMEARRPGGVEPASS